MASASLPVWRSEIWTLAQYWFVVALLATYHSAENHVKEQKSRRQILLGEVHWRISVLPLPIFSLFYCEAIRAVTKSLFRPNLDARVAATLKHGQGEISGMNRWDLRTVFTEEETIGKSPIFFLDAHWSIMLNRHGDFLFDRSFEKIDYHPNLNKNPNKENILCYPFAN